MIHRSTESITNTYRDVWNEQKTWRSLRLLLEEDGFGFSFHKTTVFAGTTTKIWYKNHQVVLFCLKGRALLEMSNTSEVISIKAGDLYTLTIEDAHLLKAQEDFETVVVFTPALTGREDHGADGSFAASDT